MDNQIGIFTHDSIVSNNDVEEQKIISLNKFIIPSFLSFDLYGIWWIYKAWRFYKQKENSDILPAARAIFCIFFLNSLFRKILVSAKEKGYQKNIPLLFYL